MSKKIAVLALCLVLLLVNGSIFTKEQHLADGKIVYLRLAPVDPRSLMQGDYMALRFHLADALYATLQKISRSQRSRHNVEASDGYVVVTLDTQSIASFKSVYKGGSLAKNELIMRYRVRNSAVKFATNAFFFQEGHGSHYQHARYGQFRVNDAGELLLARMFDDKLHPLPLNKGATSQ
ncbi:MAG: GDYXXLXY domain-containing protein [Mariprofundaceae bacterium]